MEAVDGGRCGVRSVKSGPRALVVILVVVVVVVAAAAGSVGKRGCPARVMEAYGPGTRFPKTRQLRGAPRTKGATVTRTFTRERRYSTVRCWRSGVAAMNSFGPQR